MAVATGATRRGRAEKAGPLRSRVLPSKQALRFVALTALTAGVLVAAVAALLVVTGDRSAPPRANLTAPPLPHLSPPMTHAVRWMARELPHHAAVAAPAGAARVLRHDGFRRARPGRKHAGYSVGTAAGPGVVIARFAGAPSVTVRELVAAGNVAARQQHAHERQVVAGRRLLANYAVHVAPSARELIAAGGLDLRAIRVISLLAGNHPITVAAVHVDPPEHAAGLPARVVDLRTDEQAANAVLQLLPYTDRPDTTQQLRRGGQRWTWRLRPVP